MMIYILKCNKISSAESNFYSVNQAQYCRLNHCFTINDSYGITNYTFKILVTKFCHIVFFHLSNEFDSNLHVHRYVNTKTTACEKQDTRESIFKLSITQLSTHQYYIVQFHLTITESSIKLEVSKLKRNDVTTV